MRVYGAPSAAAAANDWTLPTGALSQTYSRLTGPENGAILFSGRMTLAAVQLAAGDVVRSATYLSGQTAAVNATNQWAALYDPAGELLGVTADAGAGAWAANALKTFDFTAPITVVESGVHYLGLVVVAGTVPTLSCSGTIAGSAPINGVLPKVAANRPGATLTTPDLAPASVASVLADPTTSAGMPWAYVA